MGLLIFLSIIVSFFIFLNIIGQIVFVRSSLVRQWKASKDNLPEIRNIKFDFFYLVKEYYEDKTKFSSTIGPAFLYFKLAQIDTKDIITDIFDIKNKFLLIFCRKVILDLEYNEKSRGAFIFRNINALSYNKLIYLYAFKFLGKYYLANINSENFKKNGELNLLFVNFKSKYFQSKIDQISFMELSMEERFKYSLEHNSLTFNIKKDNWSNINVSTIYFQNNELLKVVYNFEEWENCMLNREPCCCSFNFDPFYDFYNGKIYNIYAIIDSRDIVPFGWKIPSLDDIQPFTFESGNYSTSEFYKKYGIENLVGGELLKVDSNYQFVNFDKSATFVTTSVDMVTNFVETYEFTIDNDEKVIVKVSQENIDRGFLIKCIIDETSRTDRF